MINIIFVLLPSVVDWIFNSWRILERCDLNRRLISSLIVLSHNQTLSVVAKRTDIMLQYRVGFLCYGQSASWIVILRVRFGGVSCANSFTTFRINFLRPWNPSDPFIAAPLPNALRVHLEVDFYTCPVLLILDPRPCVLFLIRVSHGTLTTLTPFLELARVNTTILPHLRTVSFHICFIELASIGLLKVSEKVGTFTLKNAIEERALIIATIWPSVPTMPIFLTILELASVIWRVRQPGFCAMTVLTIF